VWTLLKLIRGALELGVQRTAEAIDDRERRPVFDLDVRALVGFYTVSIDTVGRRIRGACGMMKRIIVAAVGLTLLLAEAALAQTEDQCDQVRAAVAQYGYRSAKAHADATMSQDAVRAADACLKRRPAAKKRHPAARERHIAR
jgi:hypothetical protein